MLVLTRKPGQLIRIWPDPDTCQHATVAEISANGLFDIHIGPILDRQVRIGIAADKRLVIMREEIAGRRR
ncbi:MAG TPA: carbon storage regulator [Acidiferrobacterales bacterium]|jgi:sRNA-binding carbon storage regulator CsrA